MDGLVAEIAIGPEQASGLGEPIRQVNQMDQVTQQNAAMVEQTTAAAANLKTEAEHLAELVRRFRMGDALRREHELKRRRVRPGAGGQRAVFLAVANAAADRE